MNCSLITLTDQQLTQLMDALAQDQPMTHATLSDMAQVERELNRRLKQTMSDLDMMLESRHAGLPGGVA